MNPVAETADTVSPCGVCPLPEPARSGQQISTSAAATKASAGDHNGHPPALASATAATQLPGKLARRPATAHGRGQDKKTPKRKDLPNFLFRRKRGKYDGGSAKEATWRSSQSPGHCRCASSGRRRHPRVALARHRRRVGLLAAPPLRPSSTRPATSRRSTSAPATWALSARRGHFDPGTRTRARRIHPRLRRRHSRYGTFAVTRPGNPCARSAGAQPEPAGRAFAQFPKEAAMPRSGAEARPLPVDRLPACKRIRRKRTSIGWVRRPRGVAKKKVGFAIVSAARSSRSRRR